MGVEICASEKCGRAIPIGVVRHVERGEDGRWAHWHLQCKPRRKPATAAPEGSGRGQD